MKDKEKQIEICENCKMKNNCSHRILVNMEKCKVNDCDYFQNISTDKEMAKDKEFKKLVRLIERTHPFYVETIAERIYKYYQPKLPENAVVLTKEAYVELKFTKNLLELREEKIKYLEDANIRYSEALENKGKETAEKIRGGLRSKLVYDDKQITIKDKYIIGETDIEEVIKEYL